METTRFDTLTRSLSTSRSRRRMLIALATSALGLFGGVEREDVAAHNALKACRKQKNPKQRAKCMKRAKKHNAKHRAQPDLCAGVACGTAPRGTMGCQNGVCGLVACDAGFGNCDGDQANGCETNIRSNRLHCGNCGFACPTGGDPGDVVSCVAGKCQVERQFSAPGGPYGFTVALAGTLTVEALGGAGGNGGVGEGSSNNSGGSGAAGARGTRVLATIPATAGDQFEVFVGGAGGTGASGAAGGFAGVGGYNATSGVSGEIPPTGVRGGGGGGGGGLSEVRRHPGAGGARVVAASGGGGGGGGGGGAMFTGQRGGTGGTGGSSTGQLGGAGGPGGPGGNSSDRDGRPGGPGQPGGGFPAGAQIVPGDNPGAGRVRLTLRAT